MNQFPVFFNLTGQRCLVVGGGEEAAAKVRLLRSAGAHVVLYSDTFCHELEQGLADGVVHRTRQHDAWLTGAYRLVIVADTPAGLAKRISADCTARGIPVNVVDKPGLCAFTVPAIVDRAPVTVAIGTGGASPVLARSLKGQIEALLPGMLGALAALYKSRRSRVKAKVAPEGRRSIWEAAHHGTVAQLAYAGDLNAAARALDSLIDHGPCRAVQPAHVELLDLRHRDADRVTLGELRWLQCAHSVVFDDTVPHTLQELCRRDAARHTLLEPASGPSVAARQISKIARPGERTVVLATGKWFDTASQRSLAARLRASGLQVDGATSAHTATVREVAL